MDEEFLYKFNAGLIIIDQISARILFLLKSFGVCRRMYSTYHCSTGVWELYHNNNSESVFAFKNKEDLIYFQLTYQTDKNGYGL